MRLASILAPLMALAALPAMATPALVRDGASDYRIVTPGKASDVETHAADVLQQYVAKVTSATLPIVPESQAPDAKRILVGRSRLVDQVAPGVDWAKLGPDGFTIKTVGDDVIIAGGRAQGTLNGVYTFLEKYVGCRKYAADVEYIPTKPTLTLPAIDDTQVPVIGFRCLYYHDADEAGYRAWHKLHDRSEWGMWVHTFRSLVPPEKYFAEHPEYFALVRGKRVADGQLCLTNPNVFDIVVNELRRRMADKPDAKYWSVSQNDTSKNCECPEATAINQREGSPMGELLTFVNKVAGAFPDKIISTLAYQYSRKPPKHLRPADNVNIVLCSIECNRSKPIATDPSSASFRDDLAGWTKITDDILVWDYVVQFTHLISPFPNLRVLQPNMQFFVDSGVRAFFMQGNREVFGEFDALRAYLIAKLLWDPNIDIDGVMNDFLSGYYGKAGPIIREYIDTMHGTLVASEQRLDIFGNPWDPADGGYLAPPLMEMYGELFDRAEAAVADEPAFLQRVKAARLPLSYATLEQAKRAGLSEAGLFQKNAAGTWEPRPEIVSLLDEFVAATKKLDVRRLTEWSLSPDEYRAQFEQRFDAAVREHLTFGKPVLLIGCRPSPKYAADPSALTDGISGGDNRNANWVGFEGTDVGMLIDLGELTPIQRIRVGALQDTRSWIFLPERVEIAVSHDGGTFLTAAKLTHDVPLTKEGVFRHEFVAELGGRSARWLKIRAINIKTCPPGHVGAGGKAWVFLDEIAAE